MMRTNNYKRNGSLRADVVALQKLGVQLLLARVENSNILKSREAVRGAYSGKVRLPLTELDMDIEG
ncbi:hypothetical protein RN01_17425 [Cupriavidus sp. SHE]|jgi:hypothetical protein|uniref:Uncharacterized protein n=1 Tax=Cupriavidus metallidurans TaxID=119219 RepID=A0A482IZY6_9BURK|nr:MULTISPECIES: hypothetical protein [Cupriavidus]KWR80934.1 hypothetical protein RN01_17425 [Cupriavidus sp. SHE]QBP14041.1 hypothetical protein DDF84_031435 [Cupriavidus metallidurans]